MKMKAVVLLCLLQIFVTGCETLKTREDIRKATQPSSPTGNTSSPTYRGEEIDNPQSEEPVAVPEVNIPTLPKIGIILGAGGAKTFAHIGLLHELNRDKIPVHIIGGVEFGAPVAALYAHREQANDAEWQLFKLKEEDLYKKNMLGAKSYVGDIKALKDFLGTAFNKVQVSNFSIPYACPSMSLKKNQVYLMNRGSLPQMMSLCMAYPPLFKPFEGSVAGVRDVPALANYMRSRGANYIILINVLEKPGGVFVAGDHNGDNVLWNEIAGLYNKPFAGVDAVVNIDTAKYGMMDFEKRREIMNQGSSAYQQLKNIVRRWGL